ncbi:MAG TPA: hemerythrin [Ramlibacter sp.]|uniref:hemerythrin n=1 Tax=Ramlibacter sp. TaxID=1917967 RepID=UPI002D80C1B3|nr:hemerythrin [Ramlibacter sp.]HET8746233.1 hemerythrin [Ramlibacter sp.]
MELGDAALDAEHAQLQGHALRLLHAAAGEDGLAALQALQAHAREHFAAEDADLRRMEGGNARCHLDEHANVLRSFEEVGAVLARDVLDAEAKQRLVQRLALQLLDWLPEHVREMDAAVARQRFQARTGGAPVRIARVPARREERRAVR